MKSGKLSWLSCVPGAAGKLVLLLAVVLAGVIPLQAQTEPNLENGFKPYGTYSGSNIDSVNLENGNLMLHIPMPFSLPQRGRIQPSYFLGITSKLWLQGFGSNSNYWYPASGGFLALVPLSRGLGFDTPLDVAVTRTTQVGRRQCRPWAQFLQRIS